MVRRNLSHPEVAICQAAWSGVNLLLFRDTEIGSLVEEELDYLESGRHLKPS